MQTNYWYPVLVGTSSTILATLIILNIESKSEISYAIIIIASLFLYSLILLTTLKIDGEKILNKDLINSNKPLEEKILFKPDNMLILFDLN